MGRVQQAPSRIQPTSDYRLKTQKSVPPRICDQIIFYKQLFLLPYGAIKPA